MSRRVSKCSSKCSRVILGTTTPLPVSERTEPIIPLISFKRSRARQSTVGLTSD